MSFLKTFSLLIVLSSLVVVTGFLAGGLVIGIIALGIAFVMNFAAYWYSDKMALSMTGAKEVNETEEPRLHYMVAEVARLAEMPKPRVFVINNDTPNAFATGRSASKAVVAVTNGIRRILSEEELRGVIAHEIAHIKNRDMLTMTVVAVLAAVISFLGTMAFYAMLFGGFRGGSRNAGGGYGALIGIVGLVVVMVVMPLAASMVRFAISRTREYAADETGARIIRNPNSLANALQKLEQGVARSPLKASATNDAMAHLYIVNPFGPKQAHKGQRDEMAMSFSGLFTTHPPIDERVRRLRDLVLY